MDRSKETPLSTVIKLISAETSGYPEVARKFIDLKSVYKGHVADSIDLEKLWREQVEIKSFKTGSRKIVTEFRYFEYHIEESISGQQATVKFSKSTENFREISYTLTLRDNFWVVTRIDYSN